MEINQAFKEFSAAIQISNLNEIKDVIKRITKCLNKEFNNSESGEDNMRIIGSIGRETAIDGISDIDILFCLPEKLFNQYNSHTNNGQSALLQRVKNAISNTYPRTDIRGDGQVVVINFVNYKIELCPAFLEEDGSFTYPDANDGGKWKTTKPIQEIKAIKELNVKTNDNLIRLCRAIRSWKNKFGIEIGGLLIDTLCYSFIAERKHFHTEGFDRFGVMVRDFFEHMSTLDKDQKFWHAPGSNQRVKRKSNFIKKSKKALAIADKALSQTEESKGLKNWKKIFGKPFPCPKELFESDVDYSNTEEFIEDYHKIDIRYSLTIECVVSQQGFRDELLSKIPFLKVNKKLRFYVKNCDVPEPYSVKWKVRNHGIEAKKRNQIRGSILSDHGDKERIENSNFSGSHYVGCYIIKDEVCVARDRIDVPISI